MPLSRGPLSRAPHFCFLLSKFQLLLRVLSQFLLWCCAFSFSAFQRLFSDLRSPISGLDFRFLLSKFQLLLRVLSKCLLLLALSLFETASAQTNVTPAQWLASQPKPNFAPGTHLPLLSTWAWPYSYALRVEMATNWGYALAFNTYNSLDGGGLQKDLTNPSSVGYQVIALCSNYPGKFALQVDLDRDFPTNVSNGFYVTNADGWFVDNNTNTWQSLTNTQYHAIISPEGPDSDWTNATERWVAPLRTLQSNAPIAIVLNGGEYGLGVSGQDNSAWQFDPRVQAARATNGLSLNLYISERKAHQLGFLTAAIQSALPGRQAYVFYGGNGNEASRFAQPGYGQWEDTWNNWGWASGVIPNSSYPSGPYQGSPTNAPIVQVINTNTDLPSWQDYYANANSWSNAPGAQWNQISDLLTIHLNAVGFDIRLGYTNSYNWVCGGWSTTSTNALADIPHYMGFLKCLYTSGMVGGVAGYFSYPTGGGNPLFGGPGFDASFPSNSPPHWLLQIVALSQVHALFSHLEGYLYNGALLSGPQPHVMSLDQPAYEFTNNAADATARVLARRMNGTNLWLVTAWAAAGPDRTVTVTIPPLGSVSVLARACGSVYQATTTNLTLIDTNSVLPTTSFLATPIPPSNLHVVPSSTN